MLEELYQEAGKAASNWGGALWPRTADDPRPQRV